jgi:uncharacterized protein (DUF1810 family)
MGKAETGDPFELGRFIRAQNAGHTYAVALDELRRGRKTSHWMWFVFPQIAGLGHSIVTSGAAPTRPPTSERSPRARPPVGNR